jgi:hypothetical protein
MSSAHQHSNSNEVIDSEGDINIVALWVKLDVIRWMAGFAAGVFSGAIALVASMVVTASTGGDLWMPLKVGALPFLGGHALEYGMGFSVYLGAAALLGLCGFLGILFAHFVRTNRFMPLFSVGATWGIFSWIFLNNLFFKSWRDFLAAGLSDAKIFFVCLLFGVSLVSLAFFDRMLRGRAL